MLLCRSHVSAFVLNQSRGGGENESDHSCCV
jgi:hypothetical protein